MHRKHVLRTGYLLTLALLCAETCATAAPGEVGSLSTERVSPKTYRLRWQPPESTNGMLRFYHLEIQMLDFDGFICPGIPLGEKLNASTPANETSFEARSMSPSARYRISIRAKTIADGPWRRLNLTTEEEVPEGPPRELRLISITERSARVSWRQPDCTLINGPITGYLTSRTTSAPWAPSEVQEDVNEPVLEMDALIPFTEYTLTVWARNSIGVGPGDSITFTTAPGVPPPPSNLTVYSATNVRLAVTWMPPYPQNGELERYLVYYQLVVGSSKPGMLYLTPAKAVCDSEARAGEHCTVLSNLHPNRRYHVVVSAKNKDVLKWSRWSNLVTAETRELVPRQQPTSSGSTVTAVILCVLILVLVAMAAVWKRRKQTIRKLPRSTSQTPAAPASDAASLSAVEENELNFEMEDMSGGGSETTSKLLPVSDLQEYVLRMLACDGLKFEFINLRKRRQYLTTEAQKIENNIKNSYGNLLPYDHSLVKLQPFTGVSQSDYINASYIDGYCRPNRYIATQGPDPHTVGDFWCMIWQENVCKIVMLTGVVEKGNKTKCQRYWPGNTANYGDIKVDFVAEENFPDCTIRELQMKLADTTREVKHFHFTSWPDHDVPLHAKPVLNFREKVNKYKAFHGAPVVVHCSAGIGSTGAYIVLDNLLEQAQAEGVVDVVGQLSAMRQDRMNVVETLEQYTFVHRALAESVCFRDHSVPCSQMYDRYGELMSPDVTTGKMNIVKEFEELQSLTPCSKPADFTAAGACAEQ